MGKRRRNFHLYSLLCLIMLIALGNVYGRIPITYSGIYTGSITSDFSSFRPTRVPTYPDEYRVYGSSPTLWGNRLDMTLRSGRSGREFYFYLPLRFYIGRYNSPDETRRIYRPWNRYESLTFGIKNSKYAASIRTGSNLYDRNYGFIPMGLLGNFKFATNNSGAIVKYNRQLSDKWSLDLYCIQPNATLFVPYAETIPQAVLDLRTGSDGAGLSVGSFSGADEGGYTQTKNTLPTYTIAGLEGTGLLQPGDRWGIYIGRKKMTDPGFRTSSSDQTVARVSKYNGENAVLGYTKDALEVNWQGKIKESELSIGASTSRADWSIYLSNNVSKSLGTVGGEALSVKLEKTQLGPINIPIISYRYIAPDYQWVMARHPDYVLVGVPIDPEDPTSPYSTRMHPDPEWQYRNPNREWEYLSEVSQFLGMRNFNMELNLPGTILNKKTSFVSAISSNKWLDERKSISLWDRDLDLIASEDYLQVKALFEIEERSDVRIKLQGVNRIYGKEGNDWLQSFQLARSYRTPQGFNWEANVDCRQRLLPTASQVGTGFRIINNLESKLGNKRFGLSVDLRHGNYDFGLVTKGVDNIVSNPYYYSQFQTYFERNTQVFFADTVALVRLAGQIWSQRSNLEEVTSGIGVIGYGSIRIPWFGGKLVQEYTIVTSKGPEASDMPTGYVVNASDLILRYNFENSPDTSIVMRSTYWPGGLGLEEKRVTSATFQISLPRGKLALTYGNGNGRRQAGTRTRDSLSPTTTYDGTKIPQLLIAGYPWDYWWPTLSTSRNPRIQYTNRYTLSYTVNF